MDPKVGPLTKRHAEVILARAAKVKNKNPAPIQITAAHILMGARSHSHPHTHTHTHTPPRKQTISDLDELDHYTLKKRTDFEGLNSTEWVKYAEWEASRMDFDRARSVFERALGVNSRDYVLWVKYAEMEMRSKFVNRARNVWDRAVVLLPRVGQLWCKYVHMEESLGNVVGARRVFERWMEWNPDEEGWVLFVMFELRYNEVDRARGVYERFVKCHPKVEVWIQFAKFEMKNGGAGGGVSRARSCYERAVEILTDDEEGERLFVAFAEFEEACKEIERARCIYKYALDRIGKGRVDEVYKKFIAFEKQYGDKEGIDDAVVGKKRFQYEDEVKKNPLNYDNWFDYVRLEEGLGIEKRVREVYERAIANVPPAQEKRYWQRYIYLW